MSEKKKASGENSQLVGKTATIYLNTRSEQEWSGVRIADVTDKAVCVEWESRGIRYFDVLCWHSISHISVRYSNADGGATEAQPA